MRENKSAAVTIAVTLLFCSILQGCGGQDFMTYFHKTQQTTVDNISDTQNPVDNREDSGEESLKENLDSSEQGNVGENTEQEETELPYTSPEVTLIMVGDILLHTPVAQSALQEDGSYNYDAIFANVKDEISAADLALVNQEVIIGGQELGISGYPTFNAPYELGDALVGAGFDVILHATNHTLDKGKRGVENCLSFWENTYPEIAVVGINESQEARDNNIYIYEQEGIRIAILNYTYGTNGIPLPSDMPYAVNLLEEEKMAADIAKAKEQADFVVVCPHWGTEYRLTQSAEQERWTEFFAENGVDLVLGTHPHVIEPVEWIPYEGVEIESTIVQNQIEDNYSAVDSSNNRGINDEKRSEDGMLVYYSLGNFVNWTASSGEGIANRMVGGMAQVTIGKDENGEAYIVEYGVEPLVCHLTKGINGVTVYRLSDYTEELASQNEIRKQDAAFSLEYCENLCEEVWGD